MEDIRSKITNLSSTNKRVYKELRDIYSNISHNTGRDNNKLITNQLVQVSIMVEAMLDIMIELTEVKKWIVNVEEYKGYSVVMYECPTCGHQSGGDSRFTNIKKHCVKCGEKLEV